MTRLPVTRAGFFLLAWLLAASLVIILWRPPLALIPMALLGFASLFFRDPERRIVAPPDAILSPADGRVMQVSDVFDNTYLGQQAIRVSIFLSLFNVHINRSPIAGRVVFVQHEKGRFRPAFNPKASVENERNRIGIEGDRGRVLTTQIAGVMARRIDCWVKQGDLVEPGQRIGMIRFGSRTELLLPKAAVEVVVQPGDKVKAGITTVAKWARPHA